MARQPSTEKERLWRQLLAEQADSGLTIKAFCQERGLQQYTFQFWKRRIRLLDNGRDDKKLDAVSFVPVTVIPSKTIANSTPTIRIALPGSIVVEIFAERGQ